MLSFESRRSVDLINELGSTSTCLALVHLLLEIGIFTTENLMPTYPCPVFSNELFVLRVEAVFGVEVGVKRQSNPRGRGGRACPQLPRRLPRLLSLSPLRRPPAQGRLTVRRPPTKARGGGRGKPARRREPPRGFGSLRGCGLPRATGRPCAPPSSRSGAGKVSPRGRDEKSRRQRVRVGVRVRAEGLGSRLGLRLESG